MCICIQVKKGEMEATVISNKISFSPENFTKEELEDIKKTIWKKCQDKIFVYKKYIGPT